MAMKLERNKRSRRKLTKELQMYEKSIEIPWSPFSFSCKAPILRCRGLPVQLSEISPSIVSPI
jgi:hypothetical protein